MNFKNHIGLFYIALLLGLQLNSYGQATGIGTLTPDSKAILDIVSTKGILLPRLNAAQQSTLATLLTATNKGLLITDSASGGATLYWTGTKFKDFDPATFGVVAPISLSATNTIALNAGTAAGDLLTWDGGSNWVNMQPTQHFNIFTDNRQPSLTLNYCIALQGVFPSRNTPFVAEISIFSFAYAPKGWALCNGQLLPINQNQALFSLLGTTYGGNGQTTFGLPNLQGRVPMHVGNGHTQGEASGSETNNVVQ